MSLTLGAWSECSKYIALLLDVSRALHITPILATVGNYNNISSKYIPCHLSYQYNIYRMPSTHLPKLKAVQYRTAVQKWREKNPVYQIVLQNYHLGSG